MTEAAVMDWIGRQLDCSLVEGSVFLIIGLITALLLHPTHTLPRHPAPPPPPPPPPRPHTIAAFTAIFGFTSFAMVGALSLIHI